MNLRAYHYVAFGQLTLGFCILVCLVLIPRYFFSIDQGGLSNYGTEEQTRLIFIFGFAVASIATFIGSLLADVNTPHLKHLRFVLRLLSLFYLLLLLSTFSYKLGDFNRQMHELAALALSLVMLYAALWMRFEAVADSGFKRAFGLFCVGFIIALLTGFEIVHLLFTSQILLGTSFGYMLTHKIHGYM